MFILIIRMNTDISMNKTILLKLKNGLNYRMIKSVLERKFKNENPA